MAFGSGAQHFYYQLKVLSSATGMRLEATISVFEEHKGRYGYRRVTAAILRVRRSHHKTVQRLCEWD